MSTDIASFLGARYAAAPAQPAAPVATIPRNTILHGDCLDLLPRLPSARVDFVLTDPPYIAHYRSRDGRSVPNDDNDAWLKPAFAEIYRVLSPHRFAVSFYGWPHADRFLTAWRAAGFRIVGHLVFPEALYLDSPACALSARMRLSAGKRRSQKAGQHHQRRDCMGL